MKTATDPYALATRMAGYYVARGWNPLPSRQDAKRPFVRYSQWWDEPAPWESLFQRYPTTNIQLVTGRRWKLLVIDLDGPEAKERFAGMGRVPATWRTHSGGNGEHVWFRLPDRALPELPKAVLWKGEGEHSAIERLCDKSLIVVPPSIHPETHKRYRFASRAQSPARLPMPTLCPDWVLRLKPLEPEREVRASPIGDKRALMRSSSVTQRYRFSDVLEAIRDKPGLAATWGLRLASKRPNAKGFLSCHAIGRDDRTPSASIAEESGFYLDFATGQTFRFFDLAVALGAYGSAAEAVNDLGTRFGAITR